MPATAITYRRAPIAAVAAGENAVIAGLAGYRYAIHGIKLIATAATAVITLKDGANALAGAITPTPGVDAGHDVQESALWETSSGNAFVVSITGAGTVSGNVWYRQIPTS
jgi:hypothetical protein